MKKPEKDSPYILNLVTVEGDGSFPCPKCGMSISPRGRDRRKL